MAALSVAKRDTDAAEEEEILRYDKENPIRGIQQITRAFSKWAERYISTCRVQPVRQQTRMEKWNGKMVQFLAANVQ